MALKAPKTAEELISRIDWKLLKKQKKTLLAVIEENEINTVLQNPERVDDLTGILNLVDSIQDFAVDIMKVDEKIVFNLHED